MCRTVFRHFKLILLIGAALTLQGCSTLNKQNAAPNILITADAHYQAGQLVQAEHLYREVVKKAPRISLAWYRLGNIYVRTNQLDAAIVAYENAILYNPYEELYWVNLSLTREMQSQRVAYQGLVYLPESDALQKLAETHAGEDLAVTMP